MTLLFHIFKTQNNANYANDYGLLSLRKSISYFVVYFDSEVLQGLLFPSHLNKEAHEKICTL